MCCFVGKTCSCFLKPFRFKIVLAPVWLQNKLALSSCYLSCWGHAHGIIWKPWDFYIRKQKILADSLRFFHKTLDLKEKCNQTKERKKNLIVRIMKIGENCEESWSCLSYTALDLVVWFERSEEVTYMIAKVIFLQSCIQVQYELKARNSNCAQIWSLSSKNLHKNQH